MTAVTTPTLDHLLDLLPPEPQPLLRLQLRTLTPLFLGGSEPQQLGTQAGSVRGVVRWWLRALLGGVVTPSGVRLDPADLARLEASVLGTTDWSPRLRVALQFPQTGRPTPEIDLGPYPRVSLAMGRFDGQHRPYYLPMTSITVEFHSLDLTGAEPAQFTASPQLMALAGAIWCWVTLGGFGTRSRRGFGALHLEHVTGPLAEAFAAWCGAAADPAAVWLPPASVTTDPADFDGASVAAAWDGFLRRGLGTAGRTADRLAGLSAVQSADEAAWLGRSGAPLPAAASPAPPLPSAPPAWSAFAPDHWRLVVTAHDRDPSTWPNNWAAAMQALDDLFHAHWHTAPTGQTADAATIAAALGAPVPDQAALPTIRLWNIEFGLPRNYFPPGNNNPHAVVQGRRASPVLARPVVLLCRPNGLPVSFGSLYLFLRAGFAPPQARFFLKRTGRNQPQLARVATPTPDLPHVVGFMANTATAPEALVDLP